MTKTTDFYYSDPKNDIFDEVKGMCLSVWHEITNPKYPNKNGGIIAGMENENGNFMTMVAMFDPQNQRTLASGLSKQSRQAIYDRYIAGGAKHEDVSFFLEQTPMSDEDLFRHKLGVLLETYEQCGYLRGKLDGMRKAWRDANVALMIVSLTLVAMWTLVIVF